MKKLGYLLLLILSLATSVRAQDIRGNSATLQGLSAGQVIFPNSSKQLTGDNALTWDNTNKVFFVGPQSGVLPLAGAILNSRLVNPASSGVASQGLAEDTGTKNVWGGSFAVSSQNTSGTRAQAQAIEGYVEQVGVGGTSTELDSILATGSVAAGTTVGELKGLFVKAPTGSGTLTTRHGIYISHSSLAGTDYGIQVEAGATSEFDGPLVAGGSVSMTRCASAGGTCGASNSGSVTIAAGATSVTVSTTKVTANSQILITQDQSLGTLLSVTCNTQSDLVVGTPEVSARSAGVSFTVIVPIAPTTNPACFNFLIVN